MIIPEKLKKGDEIRIIAPSRSASILSEEGVRDAKKTLENLGYVVTFGKHIFECDLHNSSSINHRVEDLHDAFQDTNVKGILTVIGGFNSNELLPYLDYQLIQQNPKVLCGYSDITALASAITSQCGFVTYSGPHFSSFHMTKGQAYQTEHFLSCVTKETPFTIKPSPVWSDDAWYLDQENRTFHEASWKVYNDGQAKGTIYGGNLCTFNLLQGTTYLPNVKDSILFVEDDELTIPETFARDLASILQCAQNVKGLVIGRFQNATKMTEEHLHFILDKHPILKTIPVLYDVNFGHTQPMFTFPIGGEGIIDTDSATIQLVRF